MAERTRYCVAWWIDSKGKLRTFGKDYTSETELNMAMSRVRSNEGAINYNVHWTEYRDPNRIAQEIKAQAMMRGSPVESVERLYRVKEEG